MTDISITLHNMEVATVNSIENQEQMEIVEVIVTHILKKKLYNKTDFSPLTLRISPK